MVLIPHISDLQRFQEMGAPTPLIEKLKTWSHGKQVTLIDLLPVFAEAPEGWEGFYHLPCDPHLSPAGHQKVAQEILKASNNY